MIEHVGGVQSGVPRRVVAPGANRLGRRIRPWRGEQRGQSAMCVCNNSTYVSCPALPPRQLISDWVSMLRHVYAYLSSSTSCNARLPLELGSLPPSAYS